MAAERGVSALFSRKHKVNAYQCSAYKNGDRGISMETGMERSREIPLFNAGDEAQ